MKIYHTAAQEDYDALMIELEEKGYKWHSGYKPTSKDYWSEDKENSCIRISGKDITFGTIERHKKEYPDIPIIEYKVKGENMTQEKIKQELEEISHDVSVAVSWGLRDSTVEADLQEAKSSAKNLIEKIDEYLENLKPKFKVGDYVTYEGVIENKIAKIDSINEDELHGLWYGKEKEGIRQDWWLKGGDTVRHATSEEIKEYESALNFHKHGRKPFEVKKGDLIRTPSEKIDLIWYPENYKKEEFLDYGWKLLKTAEEVNEWLGAGDE